MLDIPESLIDDLKIIRADKIRIKLCFVSWQSPSDPISNWRTVRALSNDLSDYEIQDCIDKIIHEGRYIKYCKECEQYYINGHMFDSNLCQSCATIKTGIIY
jgi:hypothetical protein